MLSHKNIDELGDRHWTVIDNYWDPQLLKEIRKKAEKIYLQGLFKPAKIGAANREQQQSQIRSDEIYWLDLEAADPLSQKLSALKAELNENFMLNLKDIECHFARYASGAGYEEHIDQSKNSVQGERLISLVLYLNTNWQPADGGQLQIREDREFVRIEPVFGRMVLMRSDSVLHSVLPSQNERWSLTGWYRRS